ncbi:hypothetical protein A3J19_00730 [Candidatus Daviesbacteria bacterium RIFCSPLOWO2_02_FULL_41_8]|uniref:Major facilitator superfamily (MFS) profile domain-containing protein n=2 Tax=Candidatus Daviesiibacteriota TaxID=1752718 RepID=A0A1F5NI59_9BACT|nr:MAG: hypothetical protein A3D83_03505 [Candidatus Daviesbacteria bacterium RIFCSPHIGHO2_02_FULL_41_10]OGE77263.1 MAG: hypothetical protein A3J19_00730 [Candidatus Daviesbacteria bacterium RIFCSPLOWO2_02_FULL_41_8]
MEKIRKQPPLFFLYLTVFITIVGFGMIFPLLPYYARQFNASEWTVGLLAASYAIAQFLLSPIWGRLSDRYGRKPIIIISLLGLGLSFLFFGLSDSLFGLFIARILQGIFSAAAISSASAYVADVTSKDQRIKGMGLLGASFSAGFIFGPGIGGVLSAVHLSFPFFLAAALALVNFISVFLFLPESLSKKTEKLNIREGLFNLKRMFNALKGEMGSFFILAFLWSFALTNNEVAVPLFGMENLNLSVATIGYFFSVQGVLAVIMQSVLLYKITHFFGEHRAVVLGLTIMAIGLFLVPFANSHILLLLFMVLMTLGSSMTRPTLVTLVSKQTKEGQGITMGIFSSFESLGRVFGPLLGGWLFSTFGFHSPFTISAVLILLTLVFVVQIKGFFRN